MYDKKTTTFSLKDQLFNKDSVTYLADHFSWVKIDFERDNFINDVVKKFPELELKQRITHMTEMLYKYLPKRYEDAIQIILQALPQELDPHKSDDDFWDFILSPLSEYVATYWCTHEHLNMSRQTLKELTKRFSVEFSIRKFINTFPDKMYWEFQQLASSKNYHQRRLVSEGSRIILPWAEKIHRTPDKIIPLLDWLYDDNTRYVTRSVSNNMNWLSKIDPELVLSTLKKRKKQWKQHEKEMTFIIKHSLRTLLKKGNKQALIMLWFTEPDHISLQAFHGDQNVILWSELIFSGTFFWSNQLWKCRVEYAVWYMKSNWKISEKVFKLYEWIIKEKSYSFDKKHSFKQMTTRVHYEGKHTITPIVNWKRYETFSFYLTV